MIGQLEPHCLKLAIDLKYEFILRIPYLFPRFVQSVVQILTRTFNLVRGRAWIVVRCSGNRDSDV